MVKCVTFVFLLFFFKTSIVTLFGFKFPARNNFKFIPQVKITKKEVIFPKKEVIFTKTTNQEQVGSSKN